MRKKKLKVNKCKKKNPIKTIKNLKGRGKTPIVNMSYDLKLSSRSFSRKFLVSGVYIYFTLYLR